MIPQTSTNPVVNSPTPSNTTTSKVISQLVSLFNTAGVVHLAGIAAIATLMGTGNVTTAVGLPILTGLVGLGVGTAVTPNNPPSN